MPWACVGGATQSPLPLRFNHFSPLMPPDMYHSCPVVHISIPVPFVSYHVQLYIHPFPFHCFLSCSFLFCCSIMSHAQNWYIPALPTYVQMASHVLLAFWTTQQRNHRCQCTPVSLPHPPAQSSPSPEIPTGRENTQPEVRPLPYMEDMHLPASQEDYTSLSGLVPPDAQPPHVWELVPVKSQLHT